MNDIVNYYLKDRANVFYGIFSAELSNEFENTMKEIIQTIGSIKDIDTWKSLVSHLKAIGRENLAQSLRQIREKFVNNIKNNCQNVKIKNELLCKYRTVSNPDVTTCGSFGSDQLTSDIDVTIEGDCFFQNLVTLKLIHKALTEVFQKYDYFKENNVFSLPKVFKFFDVNFYLSNFAIVNVDVQQDLEDNKSWKDLEKRKQALSTLPLSKFYFTQNPKQFYYAVTDAQNNVTNSNYDNLVKGVSTDMANLYNKRVHENYSIPTKQIEHSTIIDRITEIASYEDECYLTQGAFFHIVLKMQRGYALTIDINTKNIWLFMLACSIIENVKFAISHKGSRHKYLYRVYDAYRSMHHIGVETATNEVKQIYNLADSMFEEFDNITLELQTKKYNVEGNEHVNNHTLESLFIQFVEELESTKKKLSHDKTMKKTAAANVSNVLKLKIDALEKSVEVLQQQVNTHLVRDDVTNILNNIFDGFKTIAAGYMGGAKPLKRLVDSNKKPVKKNILGRERVIYIDARRKQYIKNNGTYTAIADIKATRTPRTPRKLKK